MTLKQSLECTVVTLSVILGLLVLYQSVQVFFPEAKLATEEPVKKTVQLNEATFLPSQKENLAQDPVGLLFGGDLMFDRSIRQKIDQNGSEYLFDSLHFEFKEVDMVVANLEGPITTFPSKSSGSEIGSSANYIFTFDPKVVTLLHENNFTVNLGNNHIGNFGPDGIEQTKTFLKAGGVEYFGNTGMEASSSGRVQVVSVRNMKIGFVNMNQFVKNGFQKSLSDIAYVKALSDVVVVYSHWGNEYIPEANAIIQEQAHELIDAGADVVIGSHPHVIQQHEVYETKEIFYSLGNLVFDQYQIPETQVGELVRMEIYPDKRIQFATQFVTLKTNGQTVLSE